MGFRGGKGGGGGAGVEFMRGNVHCFGVLYFWGMGEAIIP